MNADDEIRSILLDILQVGLLRIRAYGNSGFALACSIEADHLHNLPELIKSAHRKDLIDFYYNVERSAFLSETTSNTDSFIHLWDRLGRLIQGIEGDILIP